MPDMIITCQWCQQTLRIQLMFLLVSLMDLIEPKFLDQSKMLIQTSLTQISAISLPMLGRSRRTTITVPTGNNCATTMLNTSQMLLNNAKVHSIWNRQSMLLL